MVLDTGVQVPLDSGLVPLPATERDVVDEELLDLSGRSSHTFRHDEVGEDGAGATSTDEEEGSLDVPDIEHQRDAEVDHDGPAVAPSQTPAGSSCSELELRHLSQIRIRRRALEGAEEVGKDSTEDQDVAELFFSVVEATSDGDNSDAKPGSGESNDRHPSTADLVDADSIENDTGQADTAENNGHLEWIGSTSNLEEVRGVGAEDRKTNELLQNLGPGANEESL